MSLKTLWSALCNCFVTKTGFNSLFDTRLIAQKVFVSNQAMPSSTVTSYEYSSTTDQHFTAPSDGYLCITAQQSENQTYVSIWSGLGSAINGLNNLSAFVPCRKGETKWFSLSSIVSIEFISTIGGGLKAFTQSGGGLCLNPLATSERSLNSAVRKQCRPHRTSMSAHQHQRLFYRMLHRVTDTSLPVLSAVRVLQRVSLKAIFRAFGFVTIVCQQAQLSGGTSYLYGKEQRQKRCFALVRSDRIRELCSYRLSVKPSLCCQGGAL